MPLCTGRSGLSGSTPLSRLLSERHCTATGKLGSRVTLAACLQARHRLVRAPHQSAAAPSLQLASSSDPLHEMSQAHCFQSRLSMRTPHMSGSTSRSCGLRAAVRLTAHLQAGQRMVKRPCGSGTRPRSCSWLAAAAGPRSPSSCWACLHCCCCCHCHQEAKQALHTGTGWQQLDALLCGSTWCETTGHILCLTPQNPVQTLTI